MAGRLSDGARCQVEDTGCGIPAPALPYIFEWYRQAHQDPRGTGLGYGFSSAHDTRVPAVGDCL